MSEREALYRTVCENPAEDAPRLVFADWLQENGEEPLAEFIRLGCRLEGMTADHPEYVGLRVDEQRMIDCHGDGWLAPVLSPGLIRWSTDLTSPPRRRFHRGFPAWPLFQNWSPAPAGEFLDGLEALFDSTPIREVDIFSHPELAFHSSRKSELLGQLAGLFRQSAEGVGVGELESAQLCHSGLFSNLRRLYDNGEHQSEYTLADYVKAKGLPNLEHFGLYLADAAPTELRMFCRSRLAGQLRSLSFWGPDVTDWVCRHLGEVDWPGLRDLFLGHRNFGDEGVAALADSDHFPTLHRLTLGGNFQNRQTFPAVLGGTAPLVTLDLLQSQASEAALLGLTESQDPTSIRALGVGGEGVTDRFAERAAKSPGLAGLRWLFFNEARLSARGLRSVLSGDWERLASLALISGLSRDSEPEAEVKKAVSRLELPELRYLQLRGYTLAERGARALASRDCLAGLRSLRLTGCVIDGDGARALIESPHLQGLEFLDLSGNNIGTGAEPLADPDNLPRLIRCDLRGNRLPTETFRRLRGRPGVVL